MLSQSQHNDMTFDRIVTTVLCVCAITIAGALVHREMGSAGRAATDSGLPAPTMTENWQSLLSSGERIGEPNAGVQIVEFTDLECPYCRRFHEELATARKSFGRQVALTVIHFPLSMHKFAKPAARAAECARRQGRFAEFIDGVYARQDSLGFISFAQFAKDAGVPNAKLFAACLTDVTADERIEMGRRVGDSLKVRATPTVIMNGWRYTAAPTGAVLTADITALLAGKRPPDVPK